MKKYCIEWETDFCEDYPEEHGESVIEAENEKEASQKFKRYKTVILNISEVKE